MAENWSKGRDRVRRHVQGERGARGEKTNEFLDEREIVGKDRKWELGWAGLGWAGEVPRKGVGPQRRGVADPKQKVLAERNRDSQPRRV